MRKIKDKEDEIKMERLCINHGEWGERGNHGEEVKNIKFLEAISNNPFNVVYKKLYFTAYIR